jgi:hypothetical protein
MMMRINDAEFLKAEQILMVYLNQIHLAAAMYIDTMAIVRDAAINDGAGNIATACENKAAAMSDIVLSLLRPAQDQLEGKADKFIHEINTLDDYLYGPT